jgi:nucleoside-diphosphate-sugar epimerase
MRNILVTGASGFLGVALVQKLQDSDFNVIKHSSEDGDVSSIDFYKIYKEKNINHIFHLASKTFVPDSWENPAEFYKVSVNGTNNILEFCRKGNISLTFVSAYLYGRSEKLPISEGDMLLPNNPYAHSKYLAEELCRFYSQNFGVKVTIARPFNVYGRNQKPNFLIPSIINQVLHSDKIKIKDLEPKRDYIYLDDLIEGLIKTIQLNSDFNIFNFASGYSLSVKEVIDIIQSVAGSNKRVISENIERKNEIMDIVADISKAKNILGWSPKTTFEDGIRKIIEDIKNEQ